MPFKSSAEDAFTTILYEKPEPSIAKIRLNRPKTRNAQNTRLLYELNDAFDRAVQDDEVKVIILGGVGEDFSSGHDLKNRDAAEMLERYQTVGTWTGFGCEGCEGVMAREKEVYQGLSERWRNIPKPVIAQVQGRVIAAGLMLIWPCDLIVAADNALFADNTVAMGVCGAEFFQHPWELGIRRAKEMLFTADFVTAKDAHRLGMVNHIVERDQLEVFTLDLARKIAKKPLFALKLAKEAVNAAQDAQGRAGAMQTAFAYHQLSHAHNMQTLGTLIDTRGIMSDKVDYNPNVYIPPKA